MHIDSAYIREFLSTVQLPVQRMEGDRDYNDVHSERYAVTIRALLKAEIPSSAAVLEIGAAPYGMSAWLAHKFDNLSLANYAEKPTVGDLQIHINGKERHLVEYGFNVEWEQWPLPQEEFDFVTACEILEHLAMDPMALFAGVNRILKPGGHFLVSTPNAASIQNILKLGRLMPAGLAQHFRRPLSMEALYERHNREYTPFTVGEMMLAAGFEVVLMETDSAFALADMGFSEDQVAKILEIIGTPELRRDTINVIGRKIGGVVDRHPESHDLYIAADEDPKRKGVLASGAKKRKKARKAETAA